MQACVAAGGAGLAPNPQSAASIFTILVHDLIAQVADKWTMILIEILHDHGEQRFSRIADKVPTISQKMLTQTLRRMERNSLVLRTIHPVVPPRVDYRLTELGESPGEAFCGVWGWVEMHLGTVETARHSFDERKADAG